MRFMMAWGNLKGDDSRMKQIMIRSPNRRHRVTLQVGTPGDWFFYLTDDEGFKETEFLAIVAVKHPADGNEDFRALRITFLIFQVIYSWLIKPERNHDR